MNYSIPKAYLVLLIFMFSIVWLVQSASAFEFHSSNNTLKDQGTDDTEWVEFGSGDIEWKSTSMYPEYSGTTVNVQVLNESGEYETSPYVLKVEDIFFGNNTPTMADISLAQAREGAKSVRKLLFAHKEDYEAQQNLTGDNQTDENLSQDDYNWVQIDHELKVELTDITEDDQHIPHVKLNYYRRGNPKLEIAIEPSTETRYGVSVGTTNYYPGKEKDILIRVKNTGEGWADSIKLDIDLVGFSLSGNKTNISENGQISGKHISKNLEWIAKGQERTVDFTVVAPEWDKISSPFEMDPCNISVNVTGKDILGYRHKASNNISCTPVSPEPDIEISQQPYTYGIEANAVSQTDENGNKSGFALSVFNFSINNEIYMNPWYLKGSEVHGLKSCYILRESCHNLENYRLKNLSFVPPTLPDGLFLAGTYKGGETPSISDDGISPSGGEISVDIQGKTDHNNLSGNFPKTISGNKSYYADYVIIPIHPGTYELGTFSVSADCYGRNLSKTSEAVTLKVHGCNISVNKSIENATEGKVNMLITVKNTGDRPAIVRLIDRIPQEAELVQNNISVWRNGQLQNTSIPLQGWELKNSKEKSSTNVSAYLPLQPEGYYDLRYSLQPGNLSNLDLPYAKADFTEVDFEKINSSDRNYYKGTVLSSFFKSGAEVKQTWDYFENRWKVTSEHWNASTGEWEDGWDPIANRWANETYSTPANNTSANITGLEDNSVIVPSPTGPPKANSTLDKVKDFLFGLLPWGQKASGSSNLSKQPAQNSSGNESSFDKVKNFFTGLLPGGKQKPAAPSLPVPNPSNNQSSGD